MGRDEWYGNEKQKQPPEVFYTKSFSWKFCNIHRNTIVSDSYLDSLFFIKNRVQPSCFPVNIVKFLITPFLKDTCEWLLLLTEQHDV